MSNIKPEAQARTKGRSDEKVKGMRLKDWRSKRGELNAKQSHLKGKTKNLNNRHITYNIQICDNIPSNVQL